MKFVGRGRVWIGVALLCIAMFQASAEGAVTLTSSLSVSEVYNDNLFFTETNLQADYATVISPRLNLSYESRNLTLSAGYHASAEFHPRRPQADAHAQGGGLNIGLPILSRHVKGFEVSVTEDLTYAPELPAFPLGGDAAAAQAGIPTVESQQRLQTIQTPRTDTLSNRAGVAMSYKGIPRWETTVSYVNTITRYKRADLYDSVGHDTGLREAYQWSPLTQWNAFYRYSVSFSGKDSSAFVHRFGIGGQHQLTHTLSVDEGLGLSLLRGNSPQVAVNVGANENFKTGGISLRYGSDIRTGGGLTAVPTLNQHVVGIATKTLGPTSSVYFRLGYGGNRSISGPNFKISTYTAGTGIRITFLTWLSGGLSYSYLKQDTRGSIQGDGQRNQVMLGLTAGAPALKILE